MRFNDFNLDLGAPNTSNRNKRHTVIERRQRRITGTRRENEKEMENSETYTFGGLFYQRRKFNLENFLRKFKYSCNISVHSSIYQKSY